MESLRYRGGAHPFVIYIIDVVDGQGTAFNDLQERSSYKGLANSVGRSNCHVRRDNKAELRTHRLQLGTHS